MKIKENKQLIKLGKEVAKNSSWNWKISIPNKQKITEDRLFELGFSPEGSEAGDDGALELGSPNIEKGISILWIPKVGRYTSADAVGWWIYNDFGQEQLQIPLKRIKYVHQLQEFYFLLTGKKLKIKK